MLIVYVALQNLAPTWPYPCNSPKTATFQLHWLPSGSTNSTGHFTASCLCTFCSLCLVCLPPSFLSELPGSYSAFKTQLKNYLSCRYWNLLQNPQMKLVISLFKRIFLFLCYSGSHILWWFIHLLSSPCYTVNTSRTGARVLACICPISAMEPELEKVCVWMSGGMASGLSVMMVLLMLH